MRLSKILVWSLVIGTSGTLGLAVSFLIVFYGLRGVGVALARITVPGRTSVRLAPGEYWAFHEPRTVVNGVVYDRPDSVDGLRVTIADTEGDEVPAIPRVLRRYTRSRTPQSQENPCFASSLSKPQSTPLRLTSPAAGKGAPA